jgi:NAD(P)H-dependent flavin oxidoreductase YrpB (nitropropane dioxygenase family)
MGVGTILEAKRIVLLAFGEHKAPIVQRAVEGTMTDAITGLWARYLRNIYTTEYAASGAPVFPALLQSRAAQDIFGHAARQADPAWFPMPTGQSVGLIHDLPGAGEVVERVISEARAVLDRLQRSAR